MTQKAKPIRNLKCWCYYAPDGWPQVRSIGETKQESRDMLYKYSGYTMTWEEYEKKGYFLRRVIFSLTEHIKLLKK